MSIYRLTDRNFIFGDVVFTGLHTLTLSEYAKKKATDQSAHLCSLIIVLVTGRLDSVIPVVSISEI